MFLRMNDSIERGIPYRALAEFRYEIRRFLNFSERATRAAGIEPQQHQALLAIKGLPPDQVATVGYLAERLQIWHHSAVELASRVERKKLIRRSRNPADRRQVFLRLTAAGERLLRDLSHSHSKELRSAGPKLLRVLESVVRLDEKIERSKGAIARRRRERNNKTSKRR
jgi:DNA-binding MarR family transcriptional regulator